MPNISPSLPRYDEVGNVSNSPVVATAEFLQDFKFSYAAGDFANNGNIVLCDGLSAWKQMCYKVAMTPRNARAAYNSNFGIDFDLIRSAVSRLETEAFITSELTRSLMSLSGTLSVDQFVYEWEGADVLVTFVVTAKGGAPAEFHFLWVA
jgi:hypothetical protein